MLCIPERLNSGTQLYMNVVLMSLWCHIKLLVYQTREVDDIITCTRLSLLEEQAEFGGHFVTLIVCISTQE